MPLLCLALVFGVVRPFVAEMLHVASESMSPTLSDGDRVLAEKLSYRFGEPGRGDLALLEDPEKEGAPGAALVKRVVGLPGDVVAVEDGVLVVNGEPRREPYVDYRLTDSSFFGPVAVPEGHVFVLGDNRSNSSDSRSFGPVPREDLLGKVVWRLWPPERTGS